MADVPDTDVADTDCELLTWYADIDDDGWGKTPIEACEQPSWTTSTSGDCDDADPGVFPGNTEVCDGVDQDCDAVVDDGVLPTVWYEDVDGDGFGDDATLAVACEGEVTVGGDCDPLDPLVFPGASDPLGDEVDGDCDGSATVVFEGNGWTWDQPRNVVTVTTSGHAAIVTAAESTTAANPLGPVVDAESSGAEVYASISSFYPSHGMVYDMARQLTFDPSVGAWSSKLEYVGLEGSVQRPDTDLAVDADGKVWEVACADDGVAFMRVDPHFVPAWNKDGSGCDADHVECAQSTGAHGSTCWVDPSTSPPTATACDGTGCTTWALDADTGLMSESSVQSWSGEAWTDVDARGAWIAATDGIDGAVVWSGGTSWEVLPGYTIRRVTAADDGAGGVLIAAAVEDVTGDGNADVVLAWGDPDALLSAELALTDGTTTWDATSASATPAGGDVLLAASGLGSGDDAVVWAFVELL